MDKSGKFLAPKKARLLGVCVFILIIISTCLFFLDLSILRPSPNPSEYMGKTTVNNDVTYIIYFEKSLDYEYTVSTLVFEQFIQVYSELLQDDLLAQVEHRFDSVLNGFTFKLPEDDALREKFSEYIPNAAFSGDILALLYQYLVAHGENLLGSNHVELHLEKDQTMSIQE